MTPQYFFILQTNQKPKKLACRTIRDLVYAQICYVRYIFKFSNRYRVTPNINELYQGRVAVILSEFRSMDPNSLIFQPGKLCYLL